MSLQFETAIADTLGAFEFVRGGYTSAVLTLPDDSTNQDRRPRLQTTWEPPSAVERTMAHAVARYDELLRKLAD